MTLNGLEITKYCSNYFSLFYFIGFIDLKKLELFLEELAMVLRYETKIVYGEIYVCNWSRS